MKTVWRLVTHHEHPEAVLAWAIRTRRLAIGWGSIGNLRDSDYNSSERIIQFFSDQGEETSASAVLAGQCLYDFRFRVRPGDLVIVSTGKGGARRAVMEVLGDYEWGDAPDWVSGDNYRHQRKARIVDMDPDELWGAAGGKQLAGQNIHSALVQCCSPVDEVSLAAVGAHTGLSLGV
jgi:hypothetical protein